MKTHTTIVTAIALVALVALVALAAPAAQAYIPGDHSLPGKRVVVVKHANDPFACRTAKQTTDWRG
jgi:hypothetical protein